MITREDTGAVEHYTGLTGGTFKARWYGHMNDIRNYDPEDGSYGKRMSRYVGDLNSRRIPNTITWSIICRAPTYSPVTKSCRLCLMEKFMIMFEEDADRCHSGPRKPGLPVYFTTTLSVTTDDCRCQHLYETLCLEID